METTRLYDLFDRYTTGSLTATEQMELAAWVIDPANDAELAVLEARYWENLTNTSDPLPANAEKSFRTLFPGKPERNVRLTHFPRFRWVAAACVILLIGLGSYFFFFQSGGIKDETGNLTAAIDVKAPETNRAMITLANGKRVYLDSADNGQLAQQGNIQLIKLSSGQIAYQSAGGDVVKELQFNTLHNPRGSKVIEMQLADGSHVWLNAGSSVTYPIAFIGKERKVSITGEAYFEVAHNSSMPFIVSKGDIQVEVLGTKFNVNAYEDEDDIRISLLEGSVAVNLPSSVPGGRSLRLSPGQQARVRNDMTGKNPLSVYNGIDLDQVMAWKNGLFSFTRADLETVMRQIARWYDVEVTYEGKIPSFEFGGKLQKDLSLVDMLDVLTKSQVHYRIEGRRITITQ